MTEQEPLGKKIPLFRNKTFISVFAGNTLSTMGEGFNTIAIGYWVLSTTGSAKAMTAVMLPQMILGLLLGTIAGTLADRKNRRTIMLSMDLIRAVLMIGVAAVVSGSSGWGIWALVPLLTLINAASQFHSPAFQSSLIYIVGQEQVGRATGLMQVTDTLARLGGLALGGWTVAAFGGPAAVTVVGAMFALSALCVMIAGPFPIPAAKSDNRKSFWTDLRLGLAFIRKHPFARSVSLLLPSVMIFFTASMMLFQVMAVTVWHATPKEFGLMEAAIPIGYAGGSGLMLLLNRRMTRRGWWIGVSVLLAGPNLIVMSAMPDVFSALPFVFLIGFILSVGTVLVMIALRTETAAEFQGRVFGAIGSLTNLSTPVGLVMSGILSDRFGADRMLFLNGLGLTAIGLCCIALLKPLRQYR
ncbi:MFS transporter [Cohnella faecalis]|nr:MFS transporter [Cohnella faecalis]